MGSTLASAKMVGWWKFDETAGTSAADSSGTGNAGTLVGGATWAAGEINGAVKLDGTSGHVTLPIGSLIASLSNSSSFTAWVNFVQGGSWTRVFDIGTGTTVNMFLTPAQGTTGNMRFAITTAGNGAESQLTATSILAPGWHHLAVVIDGTSKAMVLYRDGQVAATATTNTLPSQLGNTNQNWLGRSQYSADGYFNGMIDDFRIYDEAVAQETVQNVIMPGLGPDLGIATWPSPATKSVDVPRDVVLGWTAGPYAATHNLYFGTTFDDVNNATAAGNGVVASIGQTTASYDPAGLLTFGQTYYWRVDEINAPSNPGTYRGNTWNFTVETYGYAVKPTKATASSSLSSLMGPEKTIDGSGLDALDQHGTSASTMWLSKKGQSPIWIQYEFDQAYKLYQMWVWNSNQAVEQSVGFGAQDVTVETSTDGTTWTAVPNVPKFEQAPGDPNYTHSTTVEFGGVQAKFVKLTILTNWADGTKQAGLSEVRFFYIPERAYSPTPATAATDVAIDSLLNWRPGRDAAKQEVYFSADATAVTGGTALAKTQTDHSLSLATLNPEYARTYYWKVNEVNDAATPSSWEGDLWSFSTPAYGVVDDFESYDDNCKRIFFTWTDGFGFSEAPKCGVTAASGNGTGSTVGNAAPPFAEQTFVHTGKQSMPMAYDNSAAANSEATRTFSVAQDWTRGGAKTLVLYFRGAADNAAAQLYVKVNGTKVDYAGSTSALTLPVWKQWNIDLAQFGASTLKAVKTLTIGVSGSGKGIVYVDDILLYRVAPAVAVPTDPGSNGLVLNYRMEADVKDSSGKGNNGTANGNPVFVSGPTGYGQAIQLEGIDDFVEVPIGTLISSMTSCSFSVWINTTATSAWQRVFDFGNGSTTGYMFLTIRDGDGRERFAISATGSETGAESFVASSKVRPTGWHHVGVVLDGVNKTLSLYLEGQLVGSATTKTIPSTLGKTTQNWLGRSQYTADPYYNGSIDEFRIYTRPLSEGEVRFLAGDK
jgi:hypothetical protein